MSVAATSESGGGGDRIVIRFREDGDEKASYNVKSTTKLSKVMKKYAEQTNRDWTQLRFQYSMFVLGAKDTPEALHMRTESFIDVEDRPPSPTWSFNSENLAVQENINTEPTPTDFVKRLTSILSEDTGMGGTSSSTSASFSAEQSQRSEPPGFPSLPKHVIAARPVVSTSDTMTNGSLSTLATSTETARDHLNYTRNEILQICVTMRENINRDPSAYSNIPLVSHPWLLKPVLARNGNSLKRALWLLGEPVSPVVSPCTVSNENINEKMNESHHSSQEDLEKKVQAIVDEYKQEEAAPVVEPQVEEAIPVVAEEERDDEEEMELPPEEFYYCDYNGDWQGPYPEARMLAWYRSSFFTSDLKIRRANFDRDYTLGSLIRRYGTANPFLPRGLRNESTKEAMIRKKMEKEFAEMSVQLKKVQDENTGLREEHGNLTTEMSRLQEEIQQMAFKIQFQFSRLGVPQKDLVNGTSKSASLPPN